MRLRNKCRAAEAAVHLAMAAANRARAAELRAMVRAYRIEAELATIGGTAAVDHLHFDDALNVEFADSQRDLSESETALSEAKAMLAEARRSGQRGAGRQDRGTADNH